MQTHPDLTQKDLFAHAIADMADAVSHRPGEGAREQRIRAQAATALIEELQPEGSLQLMLAGHCVMFHALLIESVRETMAGQPKAAAAVAGMNKAFLGNFDRLDRQRSQADAAEPQALVAPAAEIPAAPVQPPQAARPEPARPVARPLPSRHGRSLGTLTSSVAAQAAINYGGVPSVVAPPPPVPISSRT